MHLREVCTLGCLLDLNQYFLLIIDKGTDRVFCILSYQKFCFTSRASQTIRHLHWKKDPLLAH